MVSYMNSMKKMIWGDQSAAAAQNRNDDEEEKEDYTNVDIASGAISITPDQIVKQGWLFKRSRYLQ